METKNKKKNDEATERTAYIFVSLLVCSTYSVSVG